MEWGFRGKGGGGRLYKCLANLNSKRTANTLSGTDSSHLVKKLWSQICLETERNKDYTDKKGGGGGVYVCVNVCHYMLSVRCMYVCVSEEGKRV